ncbi:MBL fold metallo-hydrolase [Halarcobacter sp.]|uniref:MBL fold metallo-hydrolase n=1 Tax=Halarcobacter sp. TaxID=2321133 RepID=UPI0029F518F3|nr:MBL fold metallo-hydrolase [Halarcobacter sp.]
MRFKFLGSSDSAGIPVANCNCNICNEYRTNKKINLSTCAYLEFDDKYILLDAGNEMISNIFDMKDIKAIFLTHFHADHCLGLLRLRHSAKNIKCFHPKDELGFSDLFKHKHSITYEILEPFKSIYIDDIKITAIPLKHSKNTFGYFIETKEVNIAYLTDCYSVAKDSLDFLKSKKIDYAFIDACYDETKSKGNHLNYLQASSILDEINAKKGFLMHISHTTMEYIRNNKIKLKYRYVLDDEEFNL